MTQPKSDIVDAKTSKCKFSSLSKKKELFNYIPDEKENVSSSQFIQCNADSKKQYMYKQKKNKNKRRKMDSHIEQQRAAKRQKLNNKTTSSTLSLKKTQLQQLKYNKIEVTNNGHNQQIDELLEIVKLETEKNNNSGFYDNLIYVMDPKNRWGDTKDYIWIAKLNDKIVCFAFVAESDESVSIEMLQSFDKHKGFGTDMVQKIIRKAKNKKIKASHTLLASRPFWKKIKFFPDARSIQHLVFTKSSRQLFPEKFAICGMVPIKANEMYAYHQCRHRYKVFTNEKYKIISNFVINNCKEGIDYEYRNN